jgi:hypothetical protein
MTNFDTSISRRENFERNAANKISVPDYVDNETRYIASGVARVTTNWVKGNRTRWEAAHADHQRLRDWLLETGEFQCTWDERGNVKSHPLAIRGNGGFTDLLRKLATDLSECGGLSDKQTEIVRNALTRQAQFVADRKAKFAADNATLAATAQHIGTVGQREFFTLTIQWVKYFEGAFGATYIHGLKDAAGNVVIYKGSKCLGEKGATVTVKATVKEHGERDGVKQTIITRPASK